MWVVNTDDSSDMKDPVGMIDLVMYKILRILNVVEPTLGRGGIHCSLGQENSKRGCIQSIRTKSNSKH